MLYYLSDQRSYILHEHARQYHAAGTGWLSIKTFFHGSAAYSLGRRRYLLNDASYFVLNHAQPYSITIESDDPVESFCCFFAPGFAEAVHRSLTTPTDQLLLEPERSAILSLNFSERTYLHDHLLSPALFSLRRALMDTEREQGWLTEQVQGVMERLLQTQFNVYNEVAAVPAARAATREELYRRLHHARDYIAALCTTPITLADIAYVAGLSPNHLLRMFKAVFHQTPYQYLTAKRLEHAQQLLMYTNQPVTEIYFAVGFESLGAFSWLFHRRVGVSPRAYRRQNSVILKKHTYAMGSTITAPVVPDQRERGST